MRTVVIVQCVGREVLDRSITINELRRGLWSKPGEARITVRGISDQREIVRDELWLYAKLRAHRLGISNHARSAVHLYHTVIAHALREIFIRRPDANLL